MIEGANVKVFSGDDLSKDYFTSLFNDATVEKIDDLENQRIELQEIRKFHEVPDDLQGEPGDVWVYYPWSKLLVHTVSAPFFEFIRHSRNQDLITLKEQYSFHDKSIGVAGLNVGNPAAICMVLEGILRKGKFADNDHLSLSNLNRFRARVGDLGLNKAVLSARQAFEINPFLELEILERGIRPGGEKDFLLNPKIDVLVEEMDNIPLKVSIREEAKSSGIPVVMVTGNGENVIVDVERYDQEPDLPILNGYLRHDIIAASKSPNIINLGMNEKVLMARDFMGEKYLTKRLQESFIQIGKSLSGIPQLAESSFLRGAAVCYVVREILSRGEMPSGRYFLEMDKLTETKGKYDS